MPPKLPMRDTVLEMRYIIDHTVKGLNLHKWPVVLPKLVGMDNALPWISRCRCHTKICADLGLSNRIPVKAAKHTHAAATAGVTATRLSCPHGHIVKQASTIGINDLEPDALYNQTNRPINRPELNPVTGQE